MSLTVRDSGALRTVTEAYARSSAQSPIDRMLIRTAGGISEFYRRGIRPSVNPQSADGYTSSKTGPVVTGTVSVSITGGTAPYTHSWSSGGGIFPTVPNGSSTAFRGTPPGQTGYLSATLTDTISDANGLAASVSVDVSLTRESGA